MDNLVIRMVGFFCRHWLILLIALAMDSCEVSPLEGSDPPVSKLASKLSLGPILSQVATQTSGGILYPRENEIREVKSLDGIWNFRISPRTNPELGFKQSWYKRDFSKIGDGMIPMPVPSSYNDITQNATIRDHVGWAWYDRHFYVPTRWKNDAHTRIFLRFGSAHYESTVWVNGIQATNHSGGYLPFAVEITNMIKTSVANRITVAINNTMTPETIPQGIITFKPDQEKYPKGYFENTYNFDFFNFAGIHRPVFLYTTPKTYIDDIHVATDIDESTGIIEYIVKINSDTSDSIITTQITIFDKSNKPVAKMKGTQGVINIPNANFWWPIHTNATQGYLYTFEAKLITSNDEIIDVYRLPVGIRTVEWDQDNLLINGRKTYLRGFGKHEDYLIRGKGVDLPSIVKDYNLLQWVGANSFRTSHYPYSEEMMDFADQLGIMVVDEVPAVSLDGFGPALLRNHLAVLAELINRDKNRPSVIMWSVTNEPRSQRIAADNYFKTVADLGRSMDPTRPVGGVLSQGYSVDQAAKHFDIIGVNRYFAWYSDTGHLDVITLQMLNEVRNWRKAWKRPVFISEYGAGTIAGFHSSPAAAWTEEYQVALFEQNWKAFDQLISEGQLIGEMIWNFADFATAQGSNRVFGNKKGIFTRERQPKMAAHFVRFRYNTLTKYFDKRSLHSEIGNDINDNKSGSSASTSAERHETLELCHPITDMRIHELD